MSHDNTEALDETWGEADAEVDGSAYMLRKQNRLRGQQHDRQRVARERDTGNGERKARPVVRRQRPNRPEAFRCRHCRTMIGPVPSGGRHRNHCPVCLYSRHVDERMPGDRLSSCGGSMAPIGQFVRADGEHGLVHRCLSCGVQRQNRIAADDNFELVLALPDMTRWMPNRRATSADDDENTA